jgi:hypothetical protein
MAISFTDVDTGNTLLIDKNDIAAAYESDVYNILELITGIYVNVSDSWAYILNALSGGPPI